MRVTIFALGMAMAIAGCAVQPISGQLRKSDLDTLAVNAGEPNFMDAVKMGDKVSGADGVGLVHYNAGAVIAGPLGAAIQQAVRPASPAPQAGQRVAAAELYSMSVDGLVKSHPLMSEPPRNGIFATPYITLWELSDYRKDEQRDFVLQVLVSAHPQGVVVMRSSDIQSLHLD